MITPSHSHISGVADYITNTDQIMRTCFHCGDTTNATRPKILRQTLGRVLLEIDLSFPDRFWNRLVIDSISIRCLKNVAWSEFLFNIQTQELVDFLSVFEDDAEIPALSFVTSAGIEFKDQDVGLILLNLFNHATYHRGQITAGVTNLGYPPIDGLDFIFFLRADEQWLTFWQGRSSHAICYLLS